jgi:hypothetical protein
MELFTATEKLKKKFWQLEMLDMCTTGDTAHIDTIFKFLSHMRQHGCIDILIRTLASPSGRIVNYDEKQLSGGQNFEFLQSVQVSWIHVLRVSYHNFFVIPEYIMQRPDNEYI